MIVQVLGRIKNFLKKKIEFPKKSLTKEYSIEEASSKDISFIYERIVEESKLGNFSDDLGKEEFKKGTCHQLFRSIHLRKMPTVNGSNCESLVLIIKYNEVPIGFVWCKEFEEVDDNGWELYLTSIIKEHRGINLGKMSIEHALNFLDSKLNVYVRVYKANDNKQILNILKSLNFKISPISNDFLTINVYEKIVS